MSTKNMRDKSAYDETLARLDTRLQQTRADLQLLKDNNQRGNQEYKTQMENAASQMQRSSDANQQTN
jgi:hypothetical protein